MIASLARAIHPVRPIASRFLRATGRKFRRLAGKVDQITAHQFEVRFRGGLDSGNWRRHGENLIAHCAAHPQPVLMVIDEVPIFLARLLRQEDGHARVDGFLSWLRAVFQKGDAGFPVLILSGSIGLKPLVERLGISDRINYLDSIRLRPWNLETTAHYEARLRDGLGDAHRYRLAMEILAEAAVQGTFTSEARRQLEKRHSRLVEEAPRLVTETLEVLVHDGYLEPHPDGHRFLMKLLRDWWKARFRHHYRPLAENV